MVEVFITNIENQTQAAALTHLLETNFPVLKIHFDLAGSVTHFPCEHTILRAEGTRVDSESIIAIVTQSGFLCDILKDKVCSK